MTRVVLVTGAGGVGKTTLAAGLAVRAAESGLASLVMTVDPAHRLADALGGYSLVNHPTQHPEVRGLWAATLDAAASWEEIIRRHAPPEVADRTIANPLFEAVTSRFPAGQAYAAADQMASRIEEGRWDIVLVDTPPSEGGIDFFLAPARTRELVGAKILHWLTGARLPGRRAFFDIAARPALKLADAVLGGRLLGNVAEFLLDLRAAYDGIAHRADDIQTHLRSATTLVVATAQPTPIREAERFFLELPNAVRPPAAVVFNRILPADWTKAAALPPPPKLGVAVVENLERWAAEAHRQQEARAEFASRFRARLAEIPWMSADLTTPADLSRLVSAARGLPLDQLGIR